MNDEIKKKINERYERELNRGERFWPDSIFKDLIVSLGIFILLIVLATFIGVANEPKADPSDTSYLPRPEWYFLFLFKFLALYGQIPVIGKIEWLATVVIPGIGITLLLLLPLLDNSPYRYYSRRVFHLAIMGVIVLDIILLTIMSILPVPPNAEELTASSTLQAIGGLWIPAAILAILLALYAFRRDTYQESTRQSWPIRVVLIGALAMVVMTVVVSVRAASYPKPEEAEVPTTLVDQVLAGQDLYSVHCVECHGEDGAVTVITGVEGLEGKEISPINGSDVLCTLTDPALHEVIAYGRPNAGMTPFGKSFGGELTTAEIDYIVTFMRYMWDPRFEVPQEALKPLFPALAEGEVPSYEVHIAPIVKRYCVSCHRAGKDSNNYYMTTYEEMLTTGDHNDKNIVAGDPNSYLLQVIQGTPIPDPENPGENLIGVMPPKGHLKPDAVDAFLRWVMNGMPKTADDAAKLYAAPTVEPGTTLTPEPAITSTPTP
ncbi:MAG: c-type cytochrome [Syntrophothermus sp.]